MFLFKQVKDIQKYLERIKQQGGTIGFVPTMGALHEGHISLIRQSKKQNSCTVCSIFINPTQFNDAADLDKYPRTTSADIDLLTQAGTDVLFLPPVEEIYPDDLDTSLKLDFGQLDRVMEGFFRPGHFEGMAQVVNRLLDIVRPHQLFMGQKDFQQLTIVRNMLEQLGSSIELVMCPIIRESDGLAMSSRNRRLSKTHRKEAGILNQTLRKTHEMMGTHTPEEIKETVLKDLGVLVGFKPEYFEIVDGHTLLPITNFEDTEMIVACTAVWVGDVRLIDNMILKQ